MVSLTLFDPGFLALVVLAGGIGALLRFGIAALCARIAPDFPWGVLIVNIIGSAIGGAVMGGLSAFGLLAGFASLVLVTGFAGGFTTFSTFAVDTVQLAERDENLVKANLNVLANVLLGVGAAAGAFWLARILVGG